MKKSKMVISLVLALSMMFALCISASAHHLGTPYTQSKSTTYGTLKGEIWMYEQLTSTNRIGWELTARTSISSSYTMAQTAVSMDCVYTDTGTAPASNWSNSRADNNQNWAEVNLFFTGDNGRRITVYTAHDITYSKSDILYMTTSYYANE